ncbi:MAG TPA: diacylglycerol kinase family protein [Lacunisphaera sp.]
MKCLVIVNEDAGSPKKDVAENSPHAWRERFAKAGVEADLRTVASGQMETALRAAVASRPPALVIGGGDGTVRGAAALLVGTSIPMGILPLGTLNHFARDVGIPTELNAAIAALAGGRERLVDMGEVNGQLFINNCSLGAYADAVRRRDALRTMKPQGKWWAMLRASWSTFRRLELLRLRLRVDAEAPRVVRTPLAVVGNNRYNGYLLGRSLRPRLDEERLWLYSVRTHRHLPVLRLLTRSLVGRLDEADALSAMAATEVVIESLNGPIPVAADGEVLKLQTPMHFRIRSRALRVLVPDEREAPK